MDVNGDGKLSKEEIKNGYGQYFGRELGDEEVDEMFAKVDTDGSGEIEFDEFLLIIKNSSTKEKDSKINQFFKDMSNNTLGLKGSEDLSFGMVV